MIFGCNVIRWGCKNASTLIAGLALALMLASVNVLQAALPRAPDIDRDAASLTGHLLIAAPDLRQRAFDHTVVLLARHSREGALGFVINRPGQPHPVAEVLNALGRDSAGVEGEITVVYGGPVDPGLAFVLHSAEYSRPETLPIDGRVALSVAAEVLRDIGLGRGPYKFLLTFGYAGWAPFQLERELARGVWTTMPEDPSLIFDSDRELMWDDARARQKRR